MYGGSSPSEGFRTIRITVVSQSSKLTARGQHPHGALRLMQQTYLTIAKIVKRLRHYPFKMKTLVRIQFLTPTSEPCNLKIE